MSSSATSQPYFKESFNNYFEALPNDIPEAMGKSLAGSFLIGSLLNWSVTIGCTCCALAITLTLVNAAVKPFFDRFFPHEYHGKRLFAEVLTVAALTTAPIALGAMLAGYTFKSAALRLSQLILPALLIRIWNGASYIKGQLYYETQLNDYPPRADTMAVARRWFVV